ncbi:hypothetical protein [Deefgea salmonis]|uniref:Uncharacterized protein n=1 Tax=Deefgea salmonis TaxID=2875502 RepID=A0ABS8BMT9_9NEIS|nr:hypothetical protein [Deefgea salmonis]MCB5197052.1 hypothetical protein [Deefgea salmonis]
MADWSIWQALEEWRNKRHELDPVFARAGVAPELDSLVNRIGLDLRREAPTRPLLTGNKLRDDEEIGRYHQAYYRHYDEPLEKIDGLLRRSWVPEAGPIADLIRQEVARLRGLLKEHPGTHPAFDDVDKLLQHYLHLDHPDIMINPEVLNERRRLLMDVAGYPLQVQNALKDPYNDSVPPLSSSSFRDQLHEKMAQYLAAHWLHSKVITHWYISLALDGALARKKRDATDDARIAAMMKRRWPTLSVMMPQFEQADQIWYLLITLIAIASLFFELWWIAGGLILWLYLSVGGHQRERKEIEARRSQLAARASSMKMTRDRFAHNQISLERLSFQLRQLDEQGEYFDDTVFALLGLHQHEA